jgi:hypothetical protein
MIVIVGSANMAADAEPKMSQKDWEEMFPPLLVP